MKRPNLSRINCVKVNPSGHFFLIKGPSHANTNIGIILPIAYENTPNNPANVPTSGKEYNIDEPIPERKVSKRMRD